MVESRASHILESAIRLMHYIRENFDQDTAFKLEKKFNSAIKNMDASKFSKGVARIKENRDVKENVLKNQRRRIQRGLIMLIEDVLTEFKRTHLEHIEDIVITDGYEGGKAVVEYFRGLLVNTERHKLRSNECVCEMGRCTCCGVWEQTQ